MERQKKKNKICGKKKFWSTEDLKEGPCISHNVKFISETHVEENYYLCRKECVKKADFEDVFEAEQVCLFFYKILVIYGVQS